MAGGVTTERLAAFLRRAAGQPFIWGERDCALWVAEWVVEQTGWDAGAVWRGSFSDPTGSMRLLNREGGLLALVERIANANGFVRRCKAEPGDVVCVDFEGRQVMGIAVGNGQVALKTRTGVQVDCPPVLAAWRLE